jgi:hypothetical protein
LLLANGRLSFTANSPSLNSWKATMTSTDQQGWFFVSHLAIEDRSSIDLPFEIQVLDPLGHAVATGHLAHETKNLEIKGISIPALVIEAAKQQAIGSGSYVGEMGEVVSPFS